MRARFPLRPLAVASVLVILIVGYHRPYFWAARIVAADSVASDYAKEFAQSLTLATHWNTGEPLSNPHFYLPHRSEELKSPDGKHSLYQRPLRNSHHEIVLLRGGSTTPETILILQEGDPDSGTSHGYRWSRDSKAVFIYGAGTPAGHAYANEIALVYLVARKTLYSVALEPHLSERLQVTRNTPPLTPVPGKPNL